MPGGKRLISFGGSYRIDDAAEDPPDFMESRLLFIVFVSLFAPLAISDRPLSLPAISNVHPPREWTLQFAREFQRTRGAGPAQDPSAVLIDSSRG